MLIVWIFLIVFFCDFQFFFMQARGQKWGPEGWGPETKIQREDTQRGKKRTNFAAGEGKKSEILGGPGEGRSRGKGGPGEGRSRGKGGPNQTLKPTPTHETPL